MKAKNITLLFIALLTLCPFTQYAQEKSTSQAFWVHEDPVYPAKVSDYEEYCTILADSCEKYDIKEANWTTISTDDLRYYSLSRIDNMGDLDNSRFSLLQENMGTDEFNELFDNFDNCYDSHYDYIIHLDNELSYMPAEIAEAQNNLEFRKLEFWYMTPQNLQKVLGLAKKFKKLYADKKSKEYYQVFRSGFGAQGQFIIVSISAKSAEDYERIRKANKELLGEARTPIYNDLLKSIIKTESLNGYIRRDLSYTPKM